MSSLTSATALKLVTAVDGPIDLKKYTKIKPDVAKQLCGEADLDLSGLKEFTPALAAAFSRHHGQLILDGVTTLDKETALALKEHFGGTLQLGGMTEIADDVAQILSERETGEGTYKYWPKTLLPKIAKFEDGPGHLALFTKMVQDLDKYDVQVTSVREKQAMIMAEKGEPIDYPSLRSLSREASKALSTSKQNISLSGIKSLSAEAAEALSEHEGELSLRSLEEVSDDLALALSKHKGPIQVGGLKTLPDTKGYLELAKKLAKDNADSLRLEANSVGEQVASIFSTCGKLDLTSLTELPETDGHRRLWEKMLIGSKESETITFPWNGGAGLREIPDSFLELAAQRSVRLRLNSLSVWTEGPGHLAYAQSLFKPDPSNSMGTVTVYGNFFPNEIAEVFAKAPSVNCPEVMDFDSSPGNLDLIKKLKSNALKIRKITKEAAKVLTEGENTNVDTSNLEEVDTETFRLLFAGKDHIFLPRLKVLQPEMAKLCEASKTLGFPAIKTLSVEVAKCLGSGAGSLNLEGLETIENASLQEIVKRRGELSLGGLASLSLEQANLLKEHEGGLSLERVNEVSQEALKVLAETDTDASLSLPSVGDISAEVAGPLAQRSGRLNVASVRTLTNAPGHVALARKINDSAFMGVELKNIFVLEHVAAQEFVQTTSASFKGLTELSDDVARVFASYTGKLELPNLEKIGATGAQLLGQAPCELLLGDVDQVPDEIFSSMVNNKTALTFSATSLNLEKTRAIVKVPSLSIRKLKTLDVECAKCFKGYKGMVYMQDLEHLSPEAARELLKLKSKLSTNLNVDYFA